MKKKTKNEEKKEEEINRIKNTNKGNPDRKAISLNFLV